MKTQNRKKVINFLHFAFSLCAVAFLTGSLSTKANAGTHGSGRVPIQRQTTFQQFEDKANLSKAELSHLLALQKEHTCLTDHIFGENRRAGDDKGRIDVGAFAISEARKNGKSICEEVYSRKPKYNHWKRKWENKGAYKYSWHYKKPNINQRLAKSSIERKAYREIQDVAYQLLTTNLYEDAVSNQYTYDHYITVTLAKSKDCPSWFKYHIKSYEIRGSHVFAKLDFSKCSSRKYVELRKRLTIA